MREKREIGLVVLSTLNYGNQLVNLVLFEVLKELGYSVSLIYPPNEVSEDYRTTRNLFLDCPYDDGDIITPKSFSALLELNDVFDTFIVGGDQQFRYIFMKQTQEFSFLEWIHWSKRKLSVGTSFGLEYYENTYPYIIGKTKYWLERFQNISVREQSGVSLLNEQFKISHAKKILDPVFLGNSLYIEKLVKNLSEKKEKKYVGAYLLDITSEKKYLLQELSKQHCDGRHKVVIDAVSILKSHFNDLENDLNILYDAKVEEWLEMIWSCELLVTDSFHGVCMALLLGKPFFVVFEKNHWRGFTRIKEILHEYNLEDRIITVEQDVIRRNLYDKTIDFKQIQAEISKKRTDALRWIKNELEKEIEYETDAFHQKYINKALKYRVLAKDVKPTYVVWGAGQFFREYEEIFRENHVQYVYDSNPSKWGTEVVSGILCISMEELKKFNNVIIIIAIDNWNVEQEIIERVQAWDNVIGVTHVLQYNWPNGGIIV